MTVDDVINSDYRIVYRHIVNEARRLLLDEKYLELGHGTDEEFELAQMIAFTLHKIAPSLKDGLTLDELTAGLFPEFDDIENIDDIPDEEFIPKKVKVHRAIDLLKKIALEALEKGFSKSIEEYTTDEERESDGPDIPFYICGVYSDELKSELFFDAAPRNDDAKDRLTRLRQFYRFLGFDMTHLDNPEAEYMITQKGAGIIRLDNNIVDEEEQPIREEEGDMTDEEIDDIISNLQGNYTSENGLKEHIDLVRGCIDLIKERGKAGNGISEEELMHILLPASVNATGPELELYRTKIGDALYFINRMYYPLPKYENRLNVKHRFAPTKQQKNMHEEIEAITKKGIVTDWSFISTVKCPKSKNDIAIEPEIFKQTFIEGGFVESGNSKSKHANHIELKKSIDEYEHQEVSAVIAEDGAIAEYTHKVIFEGIDVLMMTLDEFEATNVNQLGFVKCS